MSTQSSSAGLDQPTGDDAVFRAFLDELLHVGAAVAQGIKRQAELQAQPLQEGEPPCPAVDVAEQFERVARAMRRTILLARHIAQGRAAAAGLNADPARHRTEARKQIIRAVEDRIECGSASERKSRDIDGLHAEFQERLDAPDLEDDIAHRPVAGIIEDICRDLGLEDPFNRKVRRRRTPRDVQALNARAATRTPPGPYDPGPHGPDPGAPQPKVPIRPPDRAQQRQELNDLTRQLIGA